MTDKAHVNGPPQGLRPFTLFTRLVQWRRSRRAALAAAAAYDNARTAGTPHDLAAGAAFRALTGEDRPALPDPAPAARPAPEAAEAPKADVGAAGWLARCRAL